MEWRGMAWKTVKLDVDRLGGVGWGGRPKSPERGG